MEGMEAELIIVDNASTDGSREMMAEKHPDLDYYYLEQNLGFSKGNNYGIERAKGEYVLLLNPDTVVGEDTFQACVKFMDSKDDAGGLGVYMINGQGEFLPESKRGLPTPEAAFYKMTGLSALWPKSPRFSSYHLGYLPKEETHEVQILSGAFMMIRRSVLEQIGYLDEDFFMYGEDIDLSYRIVKAGFKNYYFPETKIIHYKGESTKKSSANYVFVFYRAMVIFAQKHFSKGQASALSLFINLAIYLRAFLALISRVIGRYWQLLLDGLMSYGIFVGITQWYGQEFDKDFSLPFIGLALPAYVVVLITSLLYGGSYDRPYRLKRFIFSWILGFLLLLAIYALLPEHYRFSRAILIMGSLAGLIGAAAWRFVFHLLPFLPYSLTERAPQRRLIVSTHDGLHRISKALQAMGLPKTFTAGVSTDQSKFQLPIDFVSTLDTLDQARSSFQAEEVIFDAEALSFQSIIAEISKTHLSSDRYKIATQSGSLIIGNKSVAKAGQHEFSVQLKPTHLQRVHREKRTLDLVLSLLLLISSPLIILWVDAKARFLKNLQKVIMGKKSWVSYDPRGKAQNLPALKSGVLHSNIQVIWPENERTRALEHNWRYIANYQVWKDLEVVWRHIHLLGS